MLKFVVLASGSSGNCAYLESDGARILIDAGLSGKQIEERLNQIGRSLDDVQAVFVTHEHDDHVRGLGLLAQRKGIPVHVNRGTLEPLRQKWPSCQGWRLFETGASIPWQDLTVHTFPIPHDAYEPVGFVVEHKLGRVGFLTDLGHAPQLVRTRIRGVRALLLESNHDPALLHADTKRPWSVKQRILSRHGHLSNEAAASLLAEVMDENLEDVFLGHLSEDCNRPELAEQAAQAVFSGLTHRAPRLHRTSPDRMAQLIHWD